MYIRKPRLLRLIASWLLVQTVSQLAWPTVSYALTAGPTAPEATSFEPVDTTDMVNLNSGDLNYNIPLLEVPGPEGGYPMSLSYHAGIQPNEEASWVGLGWSLNPGAIFRNVNGYADDHQNVQQVNHDYWKGGETKTTSIGLSIGIAGTPASVSFGNSFSQDTYKGFSTSSYAGISVGIKGTPASVGVSVSNDSYGNTNAGVNVGLSKSIGGGAASALRLGGSVGLSTNFQSVSVDAGAGVSAGRTSLLGASISSSGGKPSFTVGGGSIGIHNDQAGRIQTQSNGFNIAIPVFYGAAVEYGYKYTRYWSDETVNASTNGALYYPATYQNASYYDDHAFDTYRLLDPYTENFVDNPDPDFIQGGSFPDYDNYYVTAQGLSGSMRPYAFQHGLVARTRKLADSNPVVRSRAISFQNNKLSFRFEHDFSNQYRQQAGSSWNGTAYPFDSNPSIGEGASSSSAQFGYDAATNRLVGSRHIEWFTNSEITSGSAAAKGFVDTDSPGFSRDNNAQIGGFMITNESGVTYHYALPAYSYNEHVYSELVDSVSNGPSWNHLSKPGKYAYTWFLTAMTGPDYVDRGTKGISSDDWGYWVSFNYGKWVDGYIWRNPSQGFHRDLDATYQSFSTGQKELYYLNSVATRTHTAIFEKAFRSDGKGASFLNWKHESSYRVQTPGRKDAYSSPNYDYQYPSLQLRLNRVILFSNNDLPCAPQCIAQKSFVYDRENINSRTSGFSHFGSNIIDKMDIDVLNSSTNFLQKAIRVISLQHDYSLCAGTSNSYGDESIPYDDINPSYLPTLKGKLTLNSLICAGVGGASVLPPTKFFYDLPATNSEQIKVDAVNPSTTSPSSNNLGRITLLQSNSTFRVGTILKFLSDANALIYATILEQPTDAANSQQYTVRYLNRTPTTTGYTCQAVATKNPPYLQDYVDNWGLFKSDFNNDFIGTSENSLARKTTSISGASADSWSLRRIVTPFGSSITFNYEADTYQPPVFVQPRMLAMVTGTTNANVSIAVKEADKNIGRFFLNGYDVPQAKSLFKVNDFIYLNAITGELNYAAGYIPDNDNAVRDFKYQTNIKLKILAIIDSVSKGDTYGKPVVKVQGTSPKQFYMADDAVSDRTLYMGIFTGYINDLSSNGSRQFYGGGIRVTNVSVASNGLEHQTLYNYNSSGVTSFEPAAYFSIRNHQYDQVNSTGGIKSVAQAYQQDYRDKLSKLLVIAREVVPPGVSYGQVTVAESVTRDNASFSNLGSVSYRHQTFDRSMIGLVGAPYTSTPSNGVEFRTRRIAIKDMTSRLGNLQRVTHYDSYGKALTETVYSYVSDGTTPVATTSPLYDSPAENGYLAQTAQNYEQKLAAYNYQGLVKESYGDFREVKRLDDNNYDIKGVVSQRESYPNILAATSTTDYTTGIRTSTQNLAFDFYSGVLTSTLSIDGYGNRWLTNTVPAYRKYEAMGPKGSPAASGSLPNRNMLTQTAGSITYKVDAANSPIGVVAASAQTWSNQVPVIGMDANNPENTNLQAGGAEVGDIWRPAQSYSWMPTGTTADGLTPMTGSNHFVGFDFNTVSQSLPWKLTSQTTLYNPYSNALEAKDINGVRLATKLGFNQSKVLISGGPAAYQEIAYSGAEEVKNPGDYFSGGIALTWAPDNTSTGGTAVGTGNVDRNTNPLYVHTGTASLRVGPYKHGFVYNINANTSDPTKFYLDPLKPYRASVWTNSPGGMLHYWVDGQDYSWLPGSTGVAERRTADGWYLLDIYIPPIGKNHSTLRIGCYNNGPSADAYFDDFKVQPVNAQVNSYVYDPLTGQVTDILDNNHLSTHYDYTADGKLKRVSRETFQYGGKKVAEYARYVAGALRSTTIEMGVGVATVVVPEVAGPVQIQYDLLDGLGYRALSTSNGQPYKFSVAPSRNWVRVRITDSQGRMIELAKRTQ